MSTTPTTSGLVPYARLPTPDPALRYTYGPDSAHQPGVPPGEVRELTIEDSRTFPGTHHRVWIHTPHGHEHHRPAAVTVFNDGWWYLDPEGEVRGGVVLDNLAAQGAIAPMVGVFVDPGVVGPGAGAPIVGDVDDDAGRWPRKQRNVEYDDAGRHYADFLLTEVLPQVAEHVALREAPEARAICGGSSGGNAAFTAAWSRPDGFGRAICFTSSFAQMPGGNPYTDLADATRARGGSPLRVFLHAAHRDLGWDQPRGNWFAENLRVAAALAEAGQEVRLVVGDGGHNPNQGGVLLPDALRWTWS